MVSKVAVVALVAIVACPILLGYGMNLEQNTYTDYSTSNDAIDVTPLLKNGEQYTTANADVFRLNTQFVTADNDQYPVMPYYNRTIGSRTALNFTTGYDPNWAGGGWGLSSMNKTFLSFVYKNIDGAVTVEIYSDGTLRYTINNAKYLYYEKSTDSITYTRYNPDFEMMETGHLSGGSYTHINVTFSGFSRVPIYFGFQSPIPGSDYVDFSAGFRMGNDMRFPLIKLPENTKSYLMTINLNSITQPGYRLMIGDQAHLDKDTVDGVVNWSFQDQPIYFDPSRSDNTYQYYIEITDKYELNGFIHYNTHSELRYIGGWPTLVGEARSYFTYEYDGEIVKPTYNPDTGFENVRVYTTNLNGDPELTPTIRMDAASFSAFQYPVIQDKVYDPASFKSNPATKLENIGKFGAYIIFGGTRFDVNDGNITLGTHDVSIRKAVFKSIPVIGGFDNSIGDTVISTTAAPSTITFGGEWGANVVTDSMVSTTYTKTDWTPGEFGWNGIDQNFLMIGLLAALGVFIALGIAYRKVKSALFALLVVCGGAVLLFITML